MLIKSYNLKGTVLDVKANEYTKKDGSIVKEDILYVHAGGKDIFEVSVPVNSGTAVGDLFDAPIDIYTSVFNGRELVNCRLSK